MPELLFGLDLFTSPGLHTSADKKVAQVDGSTPLFAPSGPALSSFIWSQLVDEPITLYDGRSPRIWLDKLELLRRKSFARCFQATQWLANHSRTPTQKFHSVC